MAATEKPISELTVDSTTSPTSLSGINFTVSSASGNSPSLLNGGVFASLVLGKSNGIKIWVGSTLPSSREANTLYFVTD